MAAFKCKMCGGDLTIEPGSSVCECEYCGSKQTVPTADNEKKMTMFGRANKLLRECDFDRAAAVYENIVAEFPEEAEAYWGLVLCNFGIEYVDDPASSRKVPTCHRSSYESVLKDGNYAMATDYADAAARRVYCAEAIAIEELRKDIIEVSGKEEPYDVFISYKETDENGERTLDSVIAQDIYDALTEKGCRVFFSRISLESKLGTEYEPYIFAALHSAKVMLVVGTDYEYFNAVWVKNEWSRYLKLMAADRKKSLIPCYKDISAYDMPEEFNKLTAQDMGKLGAMQDLVRGVLKLALGEKAFAAEKERMAQMREVLRKSCVSVSCGYNHTVGLRSDGSVVAEGRNTDGCCNVSGWRDIVSVSCGRWHTAGLRSDGSVVAVGDNDKGQCNVSDWRDIVSVSCGYFHTVGLRSDGSVVAVGWNKYDQCNVSGWRDIVSVSCGSHHTAGLRSDGSVVAVGLSSFRCCDVSGWRDIVSVSCGFSHTVGLRSDGSVVAVGYNGFGRCDVSGWRGIVSVSCGYNHTVGLRSDGTVVAVGENDKGQCNVSDWRDIVSVSCGDYHTVGLRSDGSVVAVGENDEGQCDVSGWKLFGSLETAVAEREEGRRKAEEERIAKIAELNAKKQQLQAELASTKGLFAGGKRKKLEAEIAAIDAQLKKLEK